MKTRGIPSTWPVIVSGAVMVVLTALVGLKLDADSASVQPERYARFLEGTRSVGP